MVSYNKILKFKFNRPFSLGNLQDLLKYNYCHPCRMLYVKVQTDRAPHWVQDSGRQNGVMKGGTLH